jgi:hypothetical protein
MSSQDEVLNDAAQINALRAKRVADLRELAASVYGFPDNILEKAQVYVSQQGDTILECVSDSKLLISFVMRLIAVANLPSPRLDMNLLYLGAKPAAAARTRARLNLAPDHPRPFKDLLQTDIAVWMRQGRPLPASD